MTGFNFLRNRLPLAAVADQVLRYAEFPQSPAVAAQSALIRDCLPGFTAENSLNIVDDNVQPRIWLGNRITTPTHVDEWNNIGCVVAGRRRFTLFPPEQIANLYIGPLDFAPTGAPMSLVSLRSPDFERYPNFREALAAAYAAALACESCPHIMFNIRVIALTTLGITVMPYASAADANSMSLDAMLARDKALELPTPYVPPPGNPLEHHAAGFAQIMCSAVFITGLDPDFAAENVGYFTAPYAERAKLGKPVVDRAAKTVSVAVPGGAVRIAQYVGDQGCVTFPIGTAHLGVTREPS